MSEPKSGKRSNREGSVRRRANGTWEARVTVGDGPEAKRVSAYGKTRAAALGAARDMQTSAEAGAPVRDAQRPFVDWLDAWLRDTLPTSGRRPSTVETYSSLARTHLRPRLERVRLRDVTPSLVQRTLAEVAAERSPSTTRQVYAVLRACLDDAVRDGLLATNPCAKVQRPGVPRTEVRVLQPAQVRAVIAAAEGHRWAPIVQLVATTGLRRGEVIGLRWSEVDLDAGRLRVTGTVGRAGGALTRGEPKTPRGWRAVPLSPALVAALRSHRVAQAEDRLRMGADWADGDYVFTTAIGTPLEPRNVSRWYATTAAAAGVDDKGMHALRHSAASMMLDAGIPVRAVSDVLGHADVSITLNTYTHALDGQTEAAINAVAAMLARSE